MYAPVVPQAHITSLRSEEVQMAGLLTSSLEVTSGLPSLFVPVKVNVHIRAHFLTKAMIKQAYHCSSGLTKTFPFQKAASDHSGCPEERTHSIG